MKKIVIYINASIILFVCIALFSCHKGNDPKPEDPQKPNEEELITTVKLILTEQISGDVSVFKFTDIDGPGGISATKETIVLDANKIYNGKIILLDQTKYPVDSISYEVNEESEDHQFFFTVSSADLSVAYTDYDDHGVPLGLFPDLTTGNAGNGKLKIILKHQPGIKPTSGIGDSTVGETDVEVSFKVIIN